MRYILIGLMWLVALSLQTYLIFALGMGIIPALVLGLCLGLFLGPISALLLFD